MAQDGWVNEHWDKERELVAQALCKSEGTGQCAAICLSHLSGSKCAEAVSVWGAKLTPL